MHVVAGGEDDAVEMVLDAVAGADADRAHRGDRPVDELAVVALQGGVVVAGDQHALAAGREVRRQLAAQPRVFDLPAQMQPAQPGRPARSAGCSTPAPVAVASWPQNSAWRRKLLGGRGFGEHLLRGRRRGEVEPRAAPSPGVRWKTLTNSACFTSSGMIWTALAPVPMTATRLPAKS